MVKRDVFDIIRTILGRFINCSILSSEIAYINGCDVYEFEKKTKIVRGLLDLLSALLSSHEDFSLFSTITRLESVTETNRNFEETLKRNAECDYCRSYIFENCEYLYIPEMELLFSEVKRAITSGNEIDISSLQDEISKIKEEFFTTPLSKMRRVNGSVSDIANASARLILMMN
jgi:hypothetical protein